MLQCLVSVPPPPGQETPCRQEPDTRQLAARGWVHYRHVSGVGHLDKVLLCLLKLLH